MTTYNKIAELERQLAEARQVGLSAISRAEKWRIALANISRRADEIMIRDLANNALLDI